MAVIDARYSTLGPVMTRDTLIDFAGVYGSSSSSVFSWYSTEGSRIDAYSFAANIDTSGLIPTGTVQLIEVGTTTASPGFVISGLNASLPALVSMPNNESFWRTVLAGTTTIYAPKSSLTAFGDFVTVGAETLTGASDIYVDGYGITSFHFFCGDANEVTAAGSLTGGADNLSIRTQGTFAGDAWKNAGHVTGGADVILVDNPVDVNLYITLGGDVTYNAGGSVTGGNDRITLRSVNVSGVFLIAGDVITSDSGVIKGGNDTIILNDANVGAISGDVSSISTGTLYAGADRITGGVHNDLVYGESGIVGVTAVITTDATHTGNDVISGGDGDDQLFGQAGNDALKGGFGLDLLDGGDGIDTADYSDQFQAVAVTLDGANSATVTIGGVAEDTIFSIENLIGGSAGDSLTGDALNNSIRGLGGADTLQGGDGSDTLTGGLGADTLTGGAGFDRFIYAAAGESPVSAGRDTITDFTINTDAALPAAYVDRIVLSAIDARASLAGNQAFAFIGDSTFTAQGQIRVQQQSLDTLVQINISGSGQTPEMEILLKGVTASLLSAADFVL